MSNTPIVPCLWLDSEAEEAASFYTRTFPGGRVLGVSRYPESADNPGGKPRGSVLTVEFEIAGQRFTALNGGPQFKINPTISFFAFTATTDETDSIFAALAEGGKVLMPIDAYPWSERYGWVQDRFGVSWQVMTGREPEGPTIVPCLMFSGAQHGRAEEAMRFYTEVFDGGSIESVARYTADEAPVGTVKHGRFVLAGQHMVAMDSHLEHEHTFDEGLSLQIMCDDQAELDRYWDRLTDGGEEGPCGWLKDRFGVSWQVVPNAMSDWMLSDDAAGRDRAFEAMLPMKKLDISALQRAFEGR